MDNIFDSLSQEDREIFKKNLLHYGLQEITPIKKELVISPRSSITLSTSPREKSYVAPIMLKTNDLDELKQWIGLNDRTVKGRNLTSRDSQREMKDYRRKLKPFDTRVSLSKEVSEANSEIRMSKSSAFQPLKSTTEKTMTRSKSSATLDAIRTYTHAYLYGDSTLVKEHKAILEAHFVSFEVPLWFFESIIVRSGSTLYLGTGSNILAAHELNIESGGKIKSFGNLTISVNRLRKSFPRKIV